VVDVVLLPIVLFGKLSCGRLNSGMLIVKVAAHWRFCAAVEN
jgi:hypothetical protein